MPFVVPQVDISAYVLGGSPAERAEVAHAIDDACRTVGFFQITGHGIPEVATAGLRKAMDDFFALSLTEKKAYRAPHNRGYSAPKSESLSLSLGVESVTRMNDFFEAFNVGVSTGDFPGLDLAVEDYGANQWPAVQGFQARVQAYFAEAGRVARTLTAIFADALDLPHGFFDAYTDHSIDVLRMNNYALPPGTVDLAGDPTGMGEHTDFGIVTVLWPTRSRGCRCSAATAPGTTSRLPRAPCWSTSVT